MATADLTISMDDGTTTAVPGAATTYTIIASNSGPTDVTGAIVEDLTPSACTWTEVTTINGVIIGSPTFGGGVVLLQFVDLPVGGAVIFTLTFLVNPLYTGTLSNTASVSPPTGTTDTNLADNFATDTNTLTPQADLSVTVTDGTAIVVPGTSDTYTITVTNNGPSTVSSLTLSDAIPAALLNSTFAPSVGAYDAATGVWDGLSLASGQNVSMTLTGTIDPNAIGSLTNTVTVAPPAGTTDTDPFADTATDTDTLTPEADLAVTMDDGRTSVVPGTSDTYTIVVQPHPD